MATKRQRVQFGPPPSGLFFAPTPAQPQNVQTAAAHQQYPRMQTPEPAGGDEQTQAVSQPAQTEEQ